LLAYHKEQHHDYVLFFTKCIPDTIRLSVVTEGSIWNTCWFYLGLLCYAVHGVHVIWTFIYKVQIIPDIKKYQTLNVPPKIIKKN
jgi:hypothetical protein